MNVQASALLGDMIVMSDRKKGPARSKFFTKLSHRQGCFISLLLDRPAPKRKHQMPNFSAACRNIIAQLFGYHSSSDFIQRNGLSRPIQPIQHQGHPLLFAGISPRRKHVIHQPPNLRSFPVSRSFFSRPSLLFAAMMMNQNLNF
jgi:hypothetical protein